MWTAQDPHARRELLEGPDVHRASPAIVGERVGDGERPPPVERGKAGPTDAARDALAQILGNGVPADRSIRVEPDLQPVVPGRPEHRFDQPALAEGRTRVQPADEQGTTLAGRRRADRIEAPELDPPRPAGPTIGAVRRVDHQVELGLDRHETDVIRRPAVANEDGRPAHLLRPLDELDEQRRPFDGGGVRRECPGMRRPECGRLDEHDVRLGSLERQEGVIRGDAIDDGVRRERTGGGSAEDPEHDRPRPCRDGDGAVLQEDPVPCPAGAGIGGDPDAHA